MEHRGDVSTGWSMGWKINLWARLKVGNRAYCLLDDQIKLVHGDGHFEAGGTYTKMLAAHPPYQIDGNFGGTAEIAEMLVHSDVCATYLIAALTDTLKRGALTPTFWRRTLRIKSTATSESPPL